MCLTQQEIADICGLTPVHVYRVLSQLRQGPCHQMRGARCCPFHALEHSRR
ncbi:helix-turn-helix domain-containing protein [Novosphingobium sp. 9]|uniref:helix-turn-helix domain-containing protein n=1 Tax=Novosphingobium sp. 9 TaxID=2025349 RepID=UPI00391F4B00